MQMSRSFPLDPRRLLDALDAIDREWLRGEAAGWRTVAGVLAVTALCLLGIHYLKYYSTFTAVLHWALGPAEARALLAGQWGSLLGDLWWGAVHLVGYVLVPALYLRLALGMRMADVGLRWRETTRWWPWYALLATPIVFFAFLASFTEAFTGTYPFYELAGRSWFDLVAWELIYLSQFLFLEYFFRGFMLETLAPRMGASAIFVMMVPYMMIHLGKPWPEAFGAILFGILLGILALRSRSIWGGALVHMTIALAMDLMSLWQTGRWPQVWWPA
jgi:membrane protease YdiL (CAAX protease family)